MQIKQLNELRSMVFLNHEGSRFSSHALPSVAQQSSIESFHFNSENQDLAFVGNSKSWVIDLGSNLSNPGGILKGFNPTTGKYNAFLAFPLPLGTIGKHVEQLTNGDYVVIANDGYSYQISEK